jgi:folate-dependent phosphoribosylglycinamide formyltransferase PurN
MIRKVLVVGHDNYGAREIFSAIVELHPDMEFFLIITTGLYYKKSFFVSVLKMLKEASIFFCFYRFREMLRYRVKGDTLFSRAKKKNVPVYFTRDVNSTSTHDVIENFAPDLIVSTFTMNIFKQPTIDLSRVATIGCHPSILPNYRGLEVFFWALANGETSSGVSVFYLNEQIDAGKVIMQEKFSITPDETVNSIYRKLTEIAGRLLVATLEKFKRNEEFSVIPSMGKGMYYSMPTREAYRKFKAAGRKWR